MTTPASAPPQQVPPGQPPPPPQQSDLDDPALILALAALLLAAISAAVVIAALKLRFAMSRALWSALEGVLASVMRHPPPVTGVIGEASAQTSRMNAARRAQYVAAAAKRVDAAVQGAQAKGEPVEAAREAALATERRYYAAHLAAMWNRATAAGKTDMAALEHGDLLGWLAILDSKTSAECRAAHGKNYYASRMPDIGYPGAVHPSCFPAGTKVASPSIRAAAMRWYSGELIELTTLRGHHLAVTPNHPVLTPQGWVAAGLLDEGRDVVSTQFGEALLGLIDPHDHQQPALIEDVLRSFGEHPGMLARPVPVAAEDFHGDASGRNGEVAVVWADRMLMDDLEAVQPQPRRIQEFGGDGRDGAVPFLGIGASAVPVPGHAPNGVMSCCDVARILLGGPAGHHEPVGVGAAATGDAIALKDLLDGRAGASVHLRQLVLAGTVDVGGTDEVHGQAAVGYAGGLPPVPGEVVGGPLVAERAAFGETVIQDALGHVQVVGDLLVSQVAGLIEFDRLVKVRRRAGWSGHVFNLESSTGWLITDNIITHNCRCMPSAPWPGGRLLPSRAFASAP